ncbi:MAG: PAS domain-containing protein, partial [Thermoplasmata archaeon]|nr:PAS domain-containing protein [Thermoplasmata archaeon]
MNGKSGESADWQNEGTVEEIEGIYSLLLESTSDSIYALDGKWRYILANGATERFTGMPKEELIGKKITEVFPDIEKTKFFETFNRVMETNKAEVISDEYTFRDGRKGWYEMRVYPSPSGILCVSRDITEQKEMEKRLRASEEAARMMLNATHDMVALADFDGTIVDLNDSLAELLGRNKSEFVGRNFKDILKKEVFEVAYSCAMEVKRTKKPFHLEYEQNGRWFDNLFYPVFDEKGEVCRIADFLQDITERKKVEEALRESEEMARTLLNATHDMVLLLEWDATILDMNDAMAKSLGVNKGEAIGENLRKYLPPEIFESRHNCAVETKKTGKPARFIDERAGKYLDNIFYPIFDENGEVFRLAVFSKDITEQKEMEGKLREAVERSQALLNATHDLVLLAKKGGIILDLNDKMAELLGGNREDIIDTPLSDHLPPEYLEERYSPAVEVEKTGKPKRIITTRDGRWFDSIYYPVFDEGGVVVGIAVFSRDITEQKKAEEKLVENQKKLRTLIEATHDMVLLIHVDGTILDLNDEMAESLRMKKGELIGTDIKEYLPPDVYELRISRVRKIQRTKEPEQFVDIRKGRWFDNHFYPVFDENGEVTQIAVFTRDIT